MVQSLPIASVFPDIIREDVPGSLWEAGVMILCVVFHTHIQMTPVVFANGGPFPRPQCHLVMYQAPVEAGTFCPSVLGPVPLWWQALASGVTVPRLFLVTMSGLIWTLGVSFQFRVSVLIFIKKQLIQALHTLR